MRVEYPISIPLVARLLSVVLTCSVGGGDQAGDWMIGAERRCIDEYALAVKGGRMHTGCMLRDLRLWRSQDSKSTGLAGKLSLEVFPLMHEIGGFTGFAF